MLLILLFIQYSFNAQHVSAVNTTIFRSLRLIDCYCMGCIWFGVCWRSVSVWLWRCGVFMQSEALPQTAYHRCVYSEEPLMMDRGTVRNM